jgi:hypothetical protein
MGKLTSLPFTVRIIMQRRALDNRWQSFQWSLFAVFADAPPDGVVAESSPQPVRLPVQKPGNEQWAFSGFSVDLFVDEAPGYFLNLSADTPCWFIMWRLDDTPGEELAIPKSITLSYNEAARWMDAGEQVETLELSEEIAAWLAAYTQIHYQPEIKKKRKRPSFEGGEGVDQMARAELDRS